MESTIIATIIATKATTNNNTTTNNNRSSCGIFEGLGGGWVIISIIMALPDSAYLSRFVLPMKAWKRHRNTLKRKGQIPDTKHSENTEKHKYF